MLLSYHIAIKKSINAALNFGNRELQCYGVEDKQLETLIKMGIINSEKNIFCADTFMLFSVLFSETGFNKKESKKSYVKAERRIVRNQK